MSVAPNILGRLLKDFFNSEIMTRVPLPDQLREGRLASSPTRKLSIHQVVRSPLERMVGVLYSYASDERRLV
jgi:hypothetical protein